MGILSAAPVWTKVGEEACAVLAGGRVVDNAN